MNGSSTTLAGQRRQVKRTHLHTPPPCRHAPWMQQVARHEGDGAQVTRSSPGYFVTQLITFEVIFLKFVFYHLCFLVFIFVFLIVCFYYLFIFYFFGLKFFFCYLVSSRLFYCSFFKCLFSIIWVLVSFFVFLFFIIYGFFIIFSCF